MSPARNSMTRCIVVTVIVAGVILGARPASRFAERRRFEQPARLSAMERCLGAC